MPAITTMDETSASDRLYPSLLDRLVDDDPARATEPRGHRAATLQRLRGNVLRDLGWLFNATRPGLDLDGDALLAGSVTNYGLPPLAGRPASQCDLDEIERTLRDAVLRFEPRILARTLVVSAERTRAGSHNVLVLRLEGRLWSRPMPLEILMRTEIDLESGAIRLTETGRD